MLNLKRVKNVELEELRTEVKNYLEAIAHKLGFTSADSLLSESKRLADLEARQKQEHQRQLQLEIQEATRLTREIQKIKETYRKSSVVQAKVVDISFTLCLGRAENGGITPIDLKTAHVSDAGNVLFFLSKAERDEWIKFKKANDELFAKNRAENIEDEATVNRLPYACEYLRSMVTFGWRLDIETYATLEKRVLRIRDSLKAEYGLLPSKPYAVPLFEGDRELYQPCLILDFHEVKK